MTKFEILDDLKKRIENDIDFKIIKEEISLIQNQIKQEIKEKVDKDR